MKLYRALALLAFAATGSGAQVPDDHDLMASRACRKLENTADCARAIEARALQFDGRARRSGDTVAIRLQNDSIVRLVDEFGGGRKPRFAQPAEYSYLGPLRRTEYLLLHAQFGEGNAYALMHARTGRLTLVPGWPIVSSDARWLLIAESGYFNDIGIYVYQVRGDTLIEAASLNPDGWVPARPRWVGATEARVERWIGSEVDARSSRRIGTLAVRRIGGQWKLHVR